MLEVISSDYVRTARAKGLSEKRVIWRHVFPNSLIPLITLMASLLPALLGGSIVIEKIFSIPGLGKLSFQALVEKDYTMIMAMVSLNAVLLVCGNLLSDLLYGVVDPRVTIEGMGKK